MFRHGSLLRRLVTMSAATALTIGLVATQAVAAAPTKTVPPKKWAKTVCPALADFVETFTGIDAELAEATSAEDGQAIIIAGIDDSIAAADDVLQTIKKAGTPDAKKGKQAVKTFNTEFDNVKETLAGAQTLIADLSTVDLQSFATQAQTIQDEVIGEFDNSFEKFDKIDAKVNSAINADASCQAIGS